MDERRRKADGRRVFSTEFKRTTVQRILTGEKTHWRRRRGDAPGGRGRGPAARLPAHFGDMPSREPTTAYGDTGHRTCSSTSRLRRYRHRHFKGKSSFINCRAASYKVSCSRSVEETPSVSR